MLDRFLAGRRYLRGLGRAQPLVLLAAALALASYAQYTIGRPIPSWTSSLSRINEALIHIYGRPQSVLLAFGLFVGACLLFVVATRKAHESETPERWPVLNLATLRQGVWGKLSLGLFVGGLTLWSYVIAKLWSGGYGETYPILFGLSLAGLAAPFVRWDLSARVRMEFGFRWWEPLLVVALSATFFALNVRDLDAWRYAFIGDEGAFFNVAREIGDGRTWNIFSQAGTYGDYPVASSAYQAMVMEVFGVDYFGWKMGSLLVLVAAIPAFYLLVRVAFGLRPAACATVFLSASHYLFAYAHTGYHHVFAVLPVVAAFAFFIIGWRYSSSLALFLAGIVSGLGFYTFASSRAAIVILALFVVTLGVRWWRPAFAGPLALGFAFVAMPIFAVDKMEVIDTVLRHSAAASQVPLAEQLLENLPRSLFAFNFNPHHGHYLAGPLMDVASGVLAVLGLSYCLSKIRSDSYRFLVIWYAVALTATGLFATYDRVAFERLHIVMPAMAAFAGIAVHRILLTLEGMAPLDRLRPATAVLALVVLVPLVFAINIQRFWGDSARQDPTHVFTVAVRAVTEGPCAGNGPGNIIVSEEWSSALDYVFDIYGPSDDRPTLLEYREVSSPGVSSDRLAEAECIVLMNMRNPSAQSLVAELRSNRPSWRVEEVTDMSGLTRILVARPPGRE